MGDRLGTPGAVGFFFCFYSFKVIVLFCNIGVREVLDFFCRQLGLNSFPSPCRGIRTAESRMMQHLFVDNVVSCLIWLSAEWRRGSVLGP